MTVREAAIRLEVSPQTVYALCAARLLRHSRVGLGRGKISISEQAIAEYLQRREVSPVIEEPCPPASPHHSPMMQPSAFRFLPPS